MKITPKFDEFQVLAKEYDVIAVSTELTADTETPLSAYAKLSKFKPAFLFESVVGGEQVSRYSFLGFSSSKEISSYSDFTEVNSKEGRNRFPTPNDPLALIEQEINGIKYCGIKGHRFSGGAVGCIGYEYANRVESSIPTPKHDELKMPLVYFMLTEVVLI